MKEFNKDIEILKKNKSGMLEMKIISKSKSLYFSKRVKQKEYKTSCKSGENRSIKYKEKIIRLKKTVSMNSTV